MVDNLIVYGEHDEATLQQAENCLRHGAEHFVLCADGHLGYSFPIGGVGVYEDKISPSGVGFDIACFAGDTRVFTLDGRNPTLAEIEGHEVTVMSCTPDGKTVPATGMCRRTRKETQLVAVTLDNGERIRCTPDHKFMLRDGGYCAARELEVGSSLMPLYTRYDKDGYVLIRNNKTRRLVRAHWMVYRAGLTVDAPELNGDKLVIHHLDFDRRNNDPSNLIPMRKKDHDAYHAAIRDRSHLNTPEFTARRLSAIELFWIKARKDPKFMAKRAATARANIRNLMKTNPGKFREVVKDNGRRGREYLIRYNRDPETIRKNRARKGVTQPCPLCGALTTSTSSLYFHAKKEHASVIESLAAPSRKTLRVRLQEHADNHRVVSIEKTEDIEDVFCLQVPGLNNFALAAGVFVHNCGNLLVITDADPDDVQDRIDVVMDDIVANISFGIGRINNHKVEDPLFDSPLWSELEFLKPLKKLAADQLGTVGSGNHYVDIFIDSYERVCVGVHFGSRGLGHKTATHFLKAVGAKDSMHADPVLLDVKSDLGEQYLKAIGLIGQYAYRGREWVCDFVVNNILGARDVDAVHNHHNFAWLEYHNGREYWVVRKGATPAVPGQWGFVGGSMGDNAYLITGRNTSESGKAFFSTVHGAGRVMSRTQARGKKGKPGLVDPGEMKTWLRNKGVTLRGGDLDEAPQAYRRLDEVIRRHAGTIQIQNVLRPIGVAMAGKDIVDPYKD